MLILQVEEWLGRGRTLSTSGLVKEPLVTNKSFATRLSLEDAIRSLAAYQRRYNEHYTLTVVFTLLSVSTTEDVSNEALELVGVELIESLKTSFD